MLLAARLLEDQAHMENFLQHSRQLLHDSRLLAEKLLEENGIPYYNEGNAGLFLWLDLSSFLRPTSSGQDQEASDSGDRWKAARLLDRQFRTQESLIMATGERYRATEPGRFRIIHCLGEDVLREGIERCVPASLRNKACTWYMLGTITNQLLFIGKGYPEGCGGIRERLIRDFDAAKRELRDDRSSRYVVFHNSRQDDVLYYLSC
jgi:hypothetical protein